MNALAGLLRRIRRILRMDNNKETVQSIIIEVTEQICNNYCKYTDLEDVDEDKFYDEYCAKCPLNRLM
jgi:hypothetical protein